MATVLVVDDDGALLRSIGRVLDRAGHQPVLAETGRQAVEALQRSAPDVLVADVRLTDMSRLDVVYRARCGIIGVPMSLLLTADGFVKLAVSGVPSLETLDEGIFLLGRLTDKSTSVRRGQPFDSLLAR